jgi:hypothetical protein
VRNDLRGMERVRRLSIAYCKKILESEGKKYSDGETETIRDLLYKLGELDYMIFAEMNTTSKTGNDQSKAA